MVVVLPEDGLHDSALRRVAEIGSDVLAAVVPIVEAVHRNRVKPSTYV